MADRVASEVNRLMKRGVVREEKQESLTDDRRSRLYWKWFQKLKALRNQAVNL